MGTRGMVIDTDIEDVERMARLVEEAGFAAGWVLETRSESVVQATLALSATQGLQVGTAVTLAFPRSPTVTGMQAWDLNRRFENRFMVGLGSQIKRLVEERFSATFDRPAKRMGEYVQAMKTVWRMEQGFPDQFKGEIYQVLRPSVDGLGSDAARPRPRVYVAAVGPLMTQMATSHADGLLGHAFTSLAYIRHSLVPRVDAGLEHAGRTRDGFQIVQGVIVSIADDREQAVRDAKRQIGFYGTTPNYEDVFASHGDEALASRLRRVWAVSGGDSDALADEVPDSAVERYAVAGRPDEVRDRLEPFEEIVDHVMLSGPWYGVPAGRSSENSAAIAEVLGHASAGDQLARSEVTS